MPQILSLLHLAWDDQTATAEQVCSPAALPLCSGLPSKLRASRLSASSHVLAGSQLHPSFSWQTPPAHLPGVTRWLVQASRLLSMPLDWTQASQNVRRRRSLTRAQRRSADLAAGVRLLCRCLLLTWSPQAVTGGCVGCFMRLGKPYAGGSSLKLMQAGRLRLTA